MANFLIISIIALGVYVASRSVWKSTKAGGCVGCKGCNNKCCGGNCSNVHSNKFRHEAILNPK